MAFTGIAALVAAETVTASLVLGAIANVGMIMTVVGGVTGNEKLMKFGGAMSLIGGVGGMIAGAATGAGAAGAAEGMAVGGADAATSAAWAEGAAGLGQDTLSSIGLDTAASTGLEGGIASAGMPDVSAALNPTDMRLAAGTQASPGIVASQTAAAASAAPTVNDVAGVDGPAGAQGPTTPYDTPTDARLAAGTQSSPMNAPQTSGSYFDRFSSWASKNKQLFSGGMQLVGGALKGANDRAMWNEKMALDQQRVNQTSYGSKVANFAPTGIIAGART
jgi:hypothetical protein